MSGQIRKRCALLIQSVFAICKLVTLEAHTGSFPMEMDYPSGAVLSEIEDPTWFALYESNYPTESDPLEPFSVSNDCNDYDLDNLPHPRIILLGPTGVGKSTLANQLLGRNPLNKSEQVFSVGHGAESHTLEISWVVGNWIGNGPCFTIIDTPGTSDGEGRDYEHALAVANIMKDQIKSVDIFLLCFNGEESRFDQSIIDHLKLYESIFSKEMWKHAITEITFWSHDKRSARKRKRNRGMDEVKRHEEWRTQYKDELDVNIEIPSVYIDPVVRINNCTH